MGYEFENIESQIGEVHALVKFKDENAKKILDSIGLECERIKRAFNQLAVSGEQEKRIWQYFHFHQEALTRLIDKVSQPRYEAADALAAIRTLLVGLLDTLKSQFPEFFDFNAPIPHFLRERALQELASSADLLKEKFIQTALDPKLLDVISDSFRNLEVVSYQKVEYLRGLRERLSNLDVSIDDPDLLRQDFCKVLINCNYNARGFFEYYTGAVKKALISCETLSDRIDLVSWYLKECYQDQSLQKSLFILICRRSMFNSASGYRMSWTTINKSSNCSCRLVCLARAMKRILS